MEHSSAVLVDFDTGFEKPAKLGPARLADEIVIDGAGQEHYHAHASARRLGQAVDHLVVGEEIGVCNVDRAPR